MNFHIISNILIESLAGFLPLLPVLLLYHVWARRNKRFSVPHAALSYLFVLVLLAIFSVTGIPNLYHLRFNLTVNLRPFGGTLEHSALNVLLFVPFGLLLPLLWKGAQKLRWTLLCGFSLSLFVELTQIFTFRATDIDDLITNTLGALVGYLLFAVARALFPRTSAFAADRKGDAFLCFALTALSMFLVQSLMTRWFYSL